MVERLKKVGLKATPQRLSLLQELDKKTHPTIDDLYQNIKKEHPSISLATVYKNLNMLKEEGLVLELPPLNGNGKSRFDIYVEPHIHIVCPVCHRIEDYYLKDAVNRCTELLKSVTYKDIEGLTVMATAICNECKNKQKRKKR